MSGRGSVVGVGWLGVAVQALADFLVDEVCHACRRPVAERSHIRLPDHPSVRALAAPVEAIGPFARLRIGTRPLCHACAADIRPVRAAARIDLPAPAPVPFTAETPASLFAFPAFEADATVLLLVHLIKFSRQRRLVPWLARAMSPGLPRDAVATGAPACLVPVPMDRASQRRRGFNQALDLARVLGGIWGVPLIDDAIVKTRRTPPQSLLARHERAANVAGAIAPGPGGSRVRARRAVIVDDLVTTGATAGACAEVLRGLGADAVCVVAAGYREQAREPPFPQS